MTASVARRGTQRRTTPYVAALVVLAPLVAETVASSNTPAVRFPLLFPVFAVVYGCPALLLRELWIRGRLTGPRLLLWGVGYTAFNEGVVAGVWFKLSPTTGKVNAFTAAQAGHAAGVNWTVAAGLVVFHTVYSQLVPVVLVQALASAGTTANSWRPWLGRRGIAVCSLLVALVLLGSLSAKATLRTCAGPALTGCTAGRRVAVLMVVLIALVVILLPRPRARAGAEAAAGEQAPSPQGRRSDAGRVLAGAAFAIAVFVAIFVLPLNGLPEVAFAADLLLFALVVVVAGRSAGHGPGDLRGDVLVTLGALLPAMALDLASWRVGQPIPVLLVAALCGYLLSRSRLRLGPHGQDSRPGLA